MRRAASATASLLRIGAHLSMMPPAFPQPAATPLQSSRWLTVILPSRTGQQWQRAHRGCSRYHATLRRVAELTAADRAVSDLHRYLISFKGAQFDRLVDGAARDEFTREDFDAVRKLNVSALRTARVSLLGDARPEVRRLLSAAPRVLDIWDVAAGDYDARLGPDSRAWQLWLLYDMQQGARSAGRGVTAGKLLHGKRPRLIPSLPRLGPRFKPKFP
jgi:hypothetical protein